MARRRATTVSGFLPRRHHTGTRGWLCHLALSFGALNLAIAAASWALTNVGIPATQIAATERWVVFLGDERAQRGAPGGCDLNGDGDCNDQVPFIRDTVTGSTTRLQFSADDFKVAGHFAAFAVDEFDSGNQDLNGDGNTSDRVLFVYDLTTATGGIGTATNTRQAMAHYEMDAQHVVFTTPEGRQGADLNGDGDRTDRVIQAWDLAASRLVNTGLAGDFFDFVGDRIAVHVSESQQGNTDLNGDGDTTDDVLHLYQFSTNTAINLGVAVTGSRISSEACIFTVSERGQGQTDLNGNGNLDQNVVQAYVFATSTLYTPNIAARGTALAVGHTHAAFAARETGQGMDLNGDGDLFDDVLHILDLRTGTVTNVGTSNQGKSVAFRDIVDFDGDNVDDVVVFVTSETYDGFTDYNGDGDTHDLILRTYDLSSGTITNIASTIRDWKRRTESLGVGIFGQKYFDVSGSRVVFLTREEGKTDLNMDGDMGDAVVQVYDLATKTLVSTDIAGDHYEARGDLIGISSRESSQANVDQNGDGDTFDWVLNIYNMAGGLPGVRTAVPIAIAPTSRLQESLAVGGGFVAYRASESAQGQTDLNGDGDRSDKVVGYAVP